MPKHFIISPNYPSLFSNYHGVTLYIFSKLYETVFLDRGLCGPPGYFSGGLR